MSFFLKQWRRDKILGKKVLNYFAYAFGEVILIIIGILLAVNINEGITNRKNDVIRCQYLEELKFTFDYDIDDVKENIASFKRWNPKLKALLIAYEEGTLMELDSLTDKIEAARRFIFFGQRSKSKIEELKYSNINLIENRDLKNRILLYEDSEIMFLRQLERRYNLVDEERRQYFSKTLFTGNLTLEELEKDDQFYSLVLQKYSENGRMENIYERVLLAQYEIKDLLAVEIENICGK